LTLIIFATTEKTMLEVTKTTEIDVETELDTNVDFVLDQDQSIDLNFDSTVDINGNLANINFDVTAIGNNSTAESNVSVVVTNGLSEVSGSLSAGVGNRTILVEFRTLDGTKNNLSHSKWGTPETQLLRLTPAAYDDGISEPRGGDPSFLPSSRAISNTVFDQSEFIPNSTGVSDWFWQWGQFLDHDLDLTPATSGETFNILVPTNDPEFDPTGTGTEEISFTRSIYDFSTGTSVNNPREQINEITAYIDGSNVYGSNNERAAALRTNDGTGKLKTSIGNNGEVLLTFNTEGLDNDDPFNRPANQLFLGGDIRANEQVGLTATHTLFVREHNRLAEEIGQRLDNGDTELVDVFEASGLSRGDFIYEAARRTVGAEIQAITYNDFLPLLLGKNTLDDYSGYDQTVNVALAMNFQQQHFVLDIRCCQQRYKMGLLKG
jgi:peroxidase